MLNDKLNEEELVRQLRGFRKAGWGAVIPRTYNGLLTEYLSGEWMELLDRIVRVAKEEGLKIWLQAGYMPAGVPDLPPAAAHRVVTRIPAGEAAGADRVWSDQHYAYCIQTRAHVVDYLNPDAVAEYLRIAYEGPWLARFGMEFGATIEALWVDEPHFSPPLLPWSALLPARFEQMWGYALAPHLGALFAPAGDHRKIRHHYWRTVSQLLVDGYFAGVSAWCERHGVRFAGHLMGEDTLQSQIGYTAAAMPCYAYMHLPGIDHLTMSLTWPSGRPFIMTPKQCASVAHQYGRQEVLAEMYGVSSQGISFGDRKRLGEWLAVLGITYRCLHGSFYSLRGRRKRLYAPHLSYQQPWWPDNRCISDPFARLSYALRQGVYAADVLVLHPVESGFCLYDSGRHQHPSGGEHEAGSMEALYDTFVTLSEHLLRIHRGYDYGDETILNRHGRVDGRNLAVGDMSYRAVILPALITLRSSSVALLQRFANGGGTIVSVGAVPERVDGIPDDRLATLLRSVISIPNDPLRLQAVLHERIPAALDVQPGGQGDSGDIWLHGRRFAGGQSYFLVNTNRDAAVAAQLRIHAPGRLESWDLHTGRIEPVPQHRDRDTLVARMLFAPSASRLLVLREKAAAADVREAPRQVVRSYTYDGALRILRQTPNALTLDWCRFRRGKDEWSELLPVTCVHAMLEQEQYQGPVALRFHFRAADKPARIHLAVEEAAAWALRINGVRVRHTGLPPFLDASFQTVNITRHTRQGDNIIEMSRAFHAVPPARFGLASLFDVLPGTELESVYVIGDFAVRGNTSAGAPQPRCVRYAPAFTLAKEQAWTNGDLLANGYPFFAGRIGLAASIRIQKPRTHERAILVLPRLGAALAKVCVNDTPAGCIIGSPGELDVTQLVRQGENTLVIELVTTLRNLLGPHHRTTGEPDSAWGHEYIFYPDWLQKPWDRQAHWTDDYFFLPFGLQEGVRIIITRGQRW